MQRSGTGVLMLMMASPILVFPMQLFQKPFAILRLSVVGVFFFSQNGCEECFEDYPHASCGL